MDFNAINSTAVRPSAVLLGHLACSVGKWRDTFQLLTFISFLSLTL